MIMLLTITGIPDPWQRVVSVKDMDEAYEMVGLIRAIELKMLIPDNPETVPTELEYMKTLKVKMKDTGLSEYPESEEELKLVLGRL